MMLYQITPGELSILVTIIFGTISVIIVAITAWINARVKIAALEVRITQVEKEIHEHKEKGTAHQVDYKQDINRIYDRQDEILKAVNEVKVELEKKANK